MFYLRITRLTGVAKSCTALPEEHSEASHPYLILRKLIMFEETFDQTKLMIHRLNCTAVAGSVVTPHKNRLCNCLLSTPTLLDLRYSLRSHILCQSMSSNGTNHVLLTLILSHHKYTGRFPPNTNESGSRSAQFASLPNRILNVSAAICILYL